MSINMVDLSSYQGELTSEDVNAIIAAGVKAAYVKATQGTNYINPDASQQVAALRDVGIKAGLYHFLDPTVTVSEQVQFFLISAAALGGSDLPVALDVEVTDPQGWSNLANMMVAFVMQVEQEPSVVRNTQSIFYVNGSFYDNLSGIPWGRGIWYAEPGVAAPTKPCLVWQSGERAVGSEGLTDWDQFMGTDAQWVVFIGGSVSPTPTPIPPQPVPVPQPIAQEFDMATLPNLTVGVVADVNVVKSVQALLIEKFNQTQLGVNGSYGVETIAALKVVQAFLHMPETGEVDQAMWEVLLTA